MKFQYARHKNQDTMMHDRGQDSSTPGPGLEGIMDRHRQKMWDWEHMTTISAKFRESEAAQLHQTAAARHTTLYQVIKKLLRSWAAAEGESGNERDAGNGNDRP